MSVLFMWLALVHGQTQHGPNKIVDAYWETVQPAGYFLLPPLPKPAEHIIEIRTKREYKTVTNWDACANGFVPEQIEREAPIGICERITKTLYIDGQRIGVIREVEEK